MKKRASFIKAIFGRSELAATSVVFALVVVGAVFQADARASRERGGAEPDSPPLIQSAQSFTNPTLINIPGASGFQQTATIASPYPSMITVSGLTGTVQKVAVTLNGLTHSYPAYVTMALVGPGGQAFGFMSGLNGQDSGMMGPWNVSNISPTFTDDASSTWFPNAALTTQAYRPMMLPNALGIFPAPGPANYSRPTNLGSATFASVFGGTNPNGDWRLYVISQCFQSNICLNPQSGAIQNGWTLTVTTQTMPHRPLVYLDGDASGDAFVYRPSSGQWVRLFTMPGGGFTESASGWGLGFSTLPARFNFDALSDLFLTNTMTGEWFKMLNTGSGFSVQATGPWGSGWQKFVMDLDADGISDVFLYDPVGGYWYKCISTPTGFTYYGGQWNPGWDITRLNLNADGLDDLFLINRTTGRWFWVLGQAGGGFTYPQQGVWYPGWKIYPGDFNGDGRSDLFLHEPSNGQYYVALNTGTGFTYQNSVWILGWTPYVVDLDGNGKADLFLYNKFTGQWYEELGDGAGHFSDAASGTWIPGWDLYPTDFNGDDRTDLLLYNPGTGQWFQAWNYNIGQFGYFGGYWQTGWTIIVGSPLR